MKKVLPYVLIAAGFIGFTYLLKKGKDLIGGGIVPDFVGVAIKWDSLLPKLELRIRLQNTSQVDLFITGFSGNIYMNGQYVGKASNPTRIDIPKLGQSIAVVYVSPSPNILQTVIQMFSNINVNNPATYGTVRATFTFDGAVNIQELTVPVKLTYKLL